MLSSFGSNPPGKYPVATNAVIEHKKTQQRHKARIKWYRIAICDAKFAVCDVTLIFCRKFCDATFACKSAIEGYTCACAQLLDSTQALKDKIMPRIIPEEEECTERKLKGLRAVTRTVVILLPACHVTTDQQAAPRIQPVRAARQLACTLCRVRLICIIYIMIIECVYAIVKYVTRLSVTVSCIVKYPTRRYVMPSAATAAKWQIVVRT